MAHAYAALYGIPCTALRFFTVYGPAGRPDMAYFSFTEKLLRGETIRVFNHGQCERDFTYVDDAVDAICRVMARAPQNMTGETGQPVPPYAVYNVGNCHPENLLDFIGVLQQALTRVGLLPADFDLRSHIGLVPMQPGDVPVTCADVTALERDFGYRSSTPLSEGLRNFAEWNRTCYAMD